MIWTNRRTTLTVAALFAALPLAAQQEAAVPAAQPGAVRHDAGLEAMRAIAFFVGNWKGEGWVRTPAGELMRFQSEEKVEARLDGRVLIVEGIHRGGDPARVLHHALATICWNSDGGHYDFRSHPVGRKGGDFIGRLEEGAFVWGSETPQSGRMRYVIRIDGPRWHEIGEYSRDGGTTWTQFFEMTLALSAPVQPAAASGPRIGRVASADGIEIVYRIQGAGAPALVFIHGGFADWSFWSPQISAFAPLHQVIAIDLAGHGESGKSRGRWTIPAFATDVLAVIAEERVERAVVIGNSLGGPIALEVARALGERVLGVVAVDTLQDMTATPPAGHFQQLAGAYRGDFDGTLRKMIDTLFHHDTAPAVRAPLEKTMLSTGTAENAATLMESFADYAYPTISQPIRCINGDLYPTAIERNRSVHSDFDAVIMAHAGHYPMVERPAEFNQHLRDILATFVATRREKED